MTKKLRHIFPRNETVCSRSALRELFWTRDVINLYLRDGWEGLAKKQDLVDTASDSVCLHLNRRSCWSGLRYFKGNLYVFFLFFRKWLWIAKILFRYHVKIKILLWKHWNGNFKVCLHSQMSPRWPNPVRDLPFREDFSATSEKTSQIRPIEDLEEATNP